jgi:hypothetical protein
MFQKVGQAPKWEQRGRKKIMESVRRCSTCTRTQIGLSFVPEDITYAVLFMDMFSVNYRNIIKIVRAASEEICFFFGGGPI